MIYQSPFSARWVLRDAAHFCKQLNDSHLATRPWPVYVAIPPDPTPIANCEVSPSGGKPLSPPPPPFDAKSEPSPTAIEDIPAIEGLLDIDNRKPYKEPELQAVRNSFERFDFQIDAQRQIVNLYFEGIKDPEDLVLYFHSFICGTLERADRFIFASWYVVGYVKGKSDSVRDSVGLCRINKKN